jgi:hypothetical protein
MRLPVRRILWFSILVVSVMIQSPSAGGSPEKTVDGKNIINSREKIRDMNEEGFIGFIIELPFEIHSYNSIRKEYTESRN